MTCIYPYLYFGQNMGNLGGELPGPGGVVGGPEVGQLALKNSGVIAVGRDGIFWRLCVGVSDHLEETLVLSHSVDCPAGVEDFVAAMPGIPAISRFQDGVMSTPDTTYSELT